MIDPILGDIPTPKPPIEREENYSWRDGWNVKALVFLVITIPIFVGILIYVINHPLNMSSGKTFKNTSVIHDTVFIHDTVYMKDPNQHGTTITISNGTVSVEDN